VLAPYNVIIFLAIGQRARAAHAYLIMGSFQSLFAVAYSQDDLAQAVEALFRSLIRAVTTGNRELAILQIRYDFNLLETSLENAEPGVRLDLAFEVAVDRLTHYKPQSQLIEAQLDLARSGMLHMLELSSTQGLGKAGRALTEYHLYHALARLDAVRNPGTPPESDDDPDTSVVPVVHDQAEAELAHEFSVLFREGIRAMSAADPRMAILNVIGSFVTIKNMVRSMTHAFYWYPIFEQAFEQFNDPPELSWLEAEQLSLARAGMRLLATQTDQIDRPRNHRSRLGFTQPDGSSKSS
jgi:hypothetical protein